MTSAAALLALMALAQSVWMLVVLRMVQGSLTGTIYSAQALVASSAPEEDTGRAMGLLQMSVYVGATLGPVAGGVVAQVAGYRAAFVGAGVLLAIATGVVVLFVREPQRRRAHPSASSESRGTASIRGILSSPAFAAVLAFSVVTQLASSSQFPILPLFVQELLRGRGSIAADTGWLLALSGLTAAGGSYLAGRFHRRFGLALPLLASGAISMILLALQATSPSYTAFLLVRAATASALGMLFALVGVWAAASSPPDAKGAAFGLLGAASSFGFGAGPLLGGLIVSLAGVRSVFVMAAALMAAAWALALARANAIVEPGSSGESRSFSAKPVTTE